MFDATTKKTHQNKKDNVIMKKDYIWANLFCSKQYSNKIEATILFRNQTSISQPAHVVCVQRNTHGRIYFTDSRWRRWRKVHKSHDSMGILFWRRRYVCVFLNLKWFLLEPMSSQREIRNKLKKDDGKNTQNHNLVQNSHLAKNVMC